MSNKTIGVIGNGFVGGAIVRGFRDYYDVKVFDVDQSRSSHTRDEVIQQDIVFVCLPTPMFRDTLGCDTSYIDEFFDDINNHFNHMGSDTVFVIKSTVPVGTTERLSETYPFLKVVHSPEFLTARNASIDFITPSRNIVGGKPNYVVDVAMLFEERFPGTACLRMTSKESEFVKYAANTFFATKISFFNELYLLADKLGLDVKNVWGGVLSDGRIGNSHHQVPGYDGDFGFGGICFPKDLNAFIETFKANDVDPVLLSAVWDRNQAIRKNKDWEKSKSAVT